ncbi:L-threonylcarbamoyladenylate synthase [Mesoplasma photuris]|uniref:L-threonylcarbamoyladenylate synthase n=1 Tax=Mesoplasma photuris TaxID=217731 RepID=UPI0004E28036|nr:Sua5/YciO/YrdC/YwlC family protein [Mesoplasma photuris]
MLTSLQIKSAVEELKINKIVILPTDTIYGLSSILKKDLMTKINAYKNADLDKPLIVLISSLDQLENKISLSEDIKKILMSDQPTTVIFPLKNETIAIRMVNRIDIKEIINQVGPIFSTSVNITGSKPLRTFKELSNFHPDIKVYYDDILNGQSSRIYNSITGEWVR